VETLRNPLVEQIFRSFQVLLSFHYLLWFWDTKYACQPDVSAMFGEHYESLLASSGALVDLKNKLQ
jgi:hypothetical protein